MCSIFYYMKKCKVDKRGIQIFILSSLRSYIYGVAIKSGISKDKKNNNKKNA